MGAVAPPPTKGVAIHCGECGETYAVARLRPDRPRHVCPACKGRLAASRLHDTFTVPAGDKALRTRAQGVVNKRLKLGWFEKPAVCIRCPGSKRICGHHQDYGKPDEVHWLCAKCHHAVHRNPALLDGIPPFVCYDRRTADQKPKPHGKGGRRGDLPPDELHRRRVARCVDLTEGDLRRMRRMYEHGALQKEIAAKFGIAQCTVGRYLRGVRKLPTPAPTETEVSHG